MLKKMMMIPVLGLLGSLAVGCSSDPCEEGVDKLEECGITGFQPTDDECTEQDECSANCVIDASCAEIEEAFSGTANDYTACVDACG